MESISKVLGKKIIIADGVIGTMMQQEVGGKCYPDELNLSNPGLVERLHNDYAANGADFITTNTFGASRLKLKELSLERKFKLINTEAVAIARRAAGKNGL
jgi:homocysteine S-methyltransferase